MSGSGNNSGDSPKRQSARSLGGKIQTEVSSALRLLFKNVAQQAINLAIPAPITLYVTEMACASHSASLKQPAIEVSQDPVATLAKASKHAHNLPLIQNAPLADDAPCHINPILCSEAVIEQSAAVITGITFANVRLTECHALPLEPLSTEIWKQDVAGFTKPTVSQMHPGRFKAKSISVKEEVPKAKVREHTGLFSLPIRKMPISPHRFNQATRDVFRSALADKAGTVARNVQLKMVFERMNVAFYTSIQQDEQGHLLCVPKNELIGKNAQGKTGQAMLKHLSRNTENAYLVVGFRVDTKQDIRAMVPVAQCPIPITYPGRQADA
jgi:hypothetical protein